MARSEGIFAAADAMKIIEERGWSRDTIGRINRHIPRLKPGTGVSAKQLDDWYDASQEALAFVQRVQDEQEAIRQMDEMGW